MAHNDTIVEENSVDLTKIENMRDKSKAVPAPKIIVTEVDAAE